jgi:DNA-binding NarL/FixJ family response regulator
MSTRVCAGSSLIHRRGALAGSGKSLAQDNSENNKVPLPPGDRSGPEFRKTPKVALAKGSIKVAIVDDDPVVRFGLRHMLGEDPAIAIAAEIEDLESLREALPRLDADIVMLDLALENTHGVEALRIFRESATRAKVIAFTSFDDEERIIQAAEFGVNGYLLKGFDQDELLDAIHTVYRGGSALESRVAEKIIKYMNRRLNSLSAPESFRFSAREKEVLELLAVGKTNREIGKSLRISESTVKFHMHAILEKLDASNRTEAVTIAAQHGLIVLHSAQ